MGEVAYSTAAAAECCVDCHLRAAPRQPRGVATYRPPPPPPAPRPTRRQALTDSVWTALERHGSVFALSDGSRTLAAYCPACGNGTVGIQILGTPNKPTVRVPDEGCTAGCDWRTVAEALQ